MCVQLSSCDHARLFFKKKKKGSEVITASTCMCVWCTFCMHDDGILQVQAKGFVLIVNCLLVLVLPRIVLSQIN